MMLRPLVGGMPLRPGVVASEARSVRCRSSDGRPADSAGAPPAGDRTSSSFSPMTSGCSTPADESAGDDGGPASNSMPAGRTGRMDSGQRTSAPGSPGNGAGRGARSLRHARPHRQGRRRASSWGAARRAGPVRYGRVVDGGGDSQSDATRTRCEPIMLGRALTGRRVLGDGGGYARSRKVGKKGRRVGEGTEGRANGREALARQLAALTSSPAAAAGHQAARRPARRPPSRWKRSYCSSPTLPSVCSRGERGRRKGGRRRCEADPRARMLRPLTSLPFRDSRRSAR